MKDNKNFMHLLGQTLATVVITCIAACLCGIVIAFTLGFLSLIF